MLVFAYDGSLNGDWVAHYAARFAANAPEKTLRLVHVQDGPPAAHIDERITRIADECRLLGVTLETDLPKDGKLGVAQCLLERTGAGSTLICGTRARPRGGALLTGTVAARLLEARQLSVVAIRVVHPGVLGQPGRVLLPLAGAPQGAARAGRLLAMFGADLRVLYWAPLNLALGTAPVAPWLVALSALGAPLLFALDLARKRLVRAEATSRSPSRPPP